MKARQQHSAYSPAYSPVAMSSHESNSKIGHADSSAGGSSSRHDPNLPVQSPVYIPPSMGGAGSSSVEGSAGSKHFVQSPQYV